MKVDKSLQEVWDWKEKVYEEMRGFSVKELIALVEQVTGKTIAVRSAQRRVGDPARLVASADKAHELLGWKAEHTDMQETLTQVLCSQLTTQKFLNTKKSLRV